MDKLKESFIELRWCKFETKPSIEEHSEKYRHTKTDLSTDARDKNKAIEGDKPHRAIWKR